MFIDDMVVAARPFDLKLGESTPAAAKIMLNRSMGFE
jgi:hypothetical protein